MKLLEHSGLMARPPDAPETADGEQELRITNKGFQFLLQDVNVQVWAFLLQYLEMAEELKMDPIDILNFLFQLGSLELGQDYSVDSLTETQKHMLDDLKHLGLIYQRKKKSSRFYPTRLATSLTSGSMVAPKPAEESRFIIIETNFKLYAYTQSPLQIAVLSLFCSLRARFANMVVGHLTRESVREALGNGITADQIITYLSTHAHPAMTSSLPSTVVDQIRLWELERNRIRASPGHLYQDFAKFEDYKVIRDYANELGYLKWFSDEKRMFVISSEGHLSVKEFYSKKRKQAWFGPCWEDEKRSNPFFDTNRSFSRAAKMHIVLKTRSGRILKDKLELPDDAKVDDLNSAIHKAFKKYPASRQRLTFQDSKTVLQSGKKLSDYNIKSGDTITFKDLGLQLGWTTVFVIEYLGPLLIHPLVYFNQGLIYGKSANMTTIQQLSLYFVLAHFLKREYETLFVHRFSNGTMPIMNLFKNNFHYWVLGGIIPAYFLYQPGFTGGFFGGVKSENYRWFLCGLFIYAELSNFVTHVTLSNLRPKGTKVRKIPFGYGFNLVSCPNYFFECLAWFSLSLLTGSLSVWFFFVVGAVQMYVWAVKKHKRYRNEFGDQYPKTRKVMIPFLL
ncbi:RNA polymerase II transcription factor B 52 kDa subunit [Chytridiales sp. JEL 0842]|nr:RNA polymerase II transcription factor B 52 kDa subunit [Chytridiales sp. JEL 0842]